jgi:hypothetical protein
MTRLKTLVLGGAAAALLATGVVSQALAEEPGSFQNRLQGATIGLPLGGAPPPGLYTGLETAYLGLANFGHNGGTAGNWSNLFGGTSVGLPAVAQAVPLLYVPGWNFLGANYSMAAVVAFYTYETCGFPAATDPNCQTTIGGGFVFANPTWTPINLSWNLHNGWFVSAGFNFMAPIGTRFTPTAFQVAGPNPDYWTLEPSFAVSYLASNWVLSANFFYDISTASTGPCCLLGAGSGNTYNNGNTLYGDFTALYKFGKWEFGPVGFFEQQVTSDSIGGPGGAALCAVFCGNYSNVAVGGLIGYDFGPVDIQVWVTDVVEAANTPAGVGSLWVWSRLGFRLWAPEAPHPLVTKN